MQINPKPQTLILTYTLGWLEWLAYWEWFSRIAQLVQSLYFHFICCCTCLLSKLNSLIELHLLCVVYRKCKTLKRCASYLHASIHNAREKGNHPTHSHWCHLQSFGELQYKDQDSLPPPFSEKQFVNLLATEVGILEQWVCHIVAFFFLFAMSQFDCPITQKNWNYAGSPQ
jgi:hypothetical protein